MSDEPMPMPDNPVLHDPVLHDPVLHDPVLHDPVLHNPVWAALTGPQAGWALGSGLARRYPADVSPFAALADHRDRQAWDDLADLLPEGSTAILMGLDGPPPAGWTARGAVPGVQMIATALTEPAESSPSAEPSEPAGPAGTHDVVELAARDVPEMLDLVSRTEPGPFATRTRELGTYLGIRHEGRLVAMAGERMRPCGFSEISAVCTDPAARGRGLAGHLVLAVASGISHRGQTPMLHAAAVNTSAIRLYQKLGFTLSLRTTFTAVATR